ncbi:DNA polymerase zeta catalytic subunit-like [Xenia sp. Carnegie-2017]|uniref:DNA polymerase zeta catalytic subunit-like n=1 Tax=Xenia sp. Carnegie-2017 TaxID=2897299 RepID=UPI001F04D65E|nr:DNA polymerase zeta catalytic subunit-like [Xenia sp. Carnegie-2017]
MDPTVKKVSHCELEVDVIAEDILNQINVESCIGHNPGITAMWEDERQRRRDIGLSSQVALLVSQESKSKCFLILPKMLKIAMMSKTLKRCVNCIWHTVNLHTGIKTPSNSWDEEEMDWKPPLRMPQVDGRGDDEDSRGHM